MRRRCCALVTVILAAPAVASAQPSDADILLRRAAELRQSGQYEQALRFVAQAAEREEGARVVGERALCEVAMERWVDAEAHLAQALAQPEDPWVARRRLSLDAALADVRAHLARVELVQGPAGARVSINGVEVGALPIRAPVRVVSGPTVILVRAPGYRDYRREVQVYAGATHFEEVLMEPLQSAARGTPAAAPVCGPGFALRDGLCYAVAPPEGAAGGDSVAGRALLWGGLAVTVIAGATVVGLGLDGDQSARDYTDRCAGPSPRATCDAEYAATQGFLDGRATAVNAMVAVAAVGLAATITGAVLELRRGARHGVAVALAPGALRVAW